MAKKIKEIRVSYGVKRKLAEDTGYSEITVRHALRYYTDTEAARLIRKRAIERYGGVVARREVG